MDFEIRPAQKADLESLPEIELSAAQLLLEYVPELDLGYVTPAQEFEQAMAAGLLWVALVADRPVGFGLVEILGDGQPHFEELDVLPGLQRRGIGTALVREVCQWFMASSHRQLTLTTFRHVPWNAPLYSRLGFEVLDPPDYTKEIRHLIDQESRHGLDPGQRVVMYFSSDSRLS